jgi:hypothetical protein
LAFTDLLKFASHSDQHFRLSTGSKGISHQSHCQTGAIQT